MQIELPVDCAGSTHRVDDWANQSLLSNAGPNCQTLRVKFVNVHSGMGVVGLALVPVSEVLVVDKSAEMEVAFVGEHHSVCKSEVALNKVDEFVAALDTSGPVLICKKAVRR